MSEPDEPEASSGIRESLPSAPSVDVTFDIPRPSRRTTLSILATVFITAGAATAFTQSLQVENSWLSLTALVLGLASIGVATTIPRPVSQPAAQHLTREQTRRLGYLLVGGLLGAFGLVGATLLFALTATPSVYATFGLWTGTLVLVSITLAGPLYAYSRRHK